MATRKFAIKTKLKEVHFFIPLKFSQITGNTGAREAYLTQSYATQVQIKSLNETFTSRFISVIMNWFHCLKNRKKRVDGCTLEAKVTYGIFRLSNPEAHY